VPPTEIPEELLTPPRWLHKYAKQFWLRNAPWLARAGRLKVHHLGAWISVCQEYGTYERLVRRLTRIAVTSDDFAKLGGAARQTLIRYQSGCLRFGLDPAADLRLSTLDGSDVVDQRPAAAAPAAALEEDRGEAWLRTYGNGR